MKSTTPITFRAVENHNIDAQVLADTTLAIFPRAISQQLVILVRVISHSTKKMLVFSQELYEVLAREATTIELPQCVKALAFESKSFGLIDLTRENAVF